MNIFDVKGLYDRKEFGQVVEAYGGMDRSAVFTAWEYMRYCTALRKLNRLDEALEIGREGMGRFPDADPVKSAYCWCLFERFLKNPGNGEVPEAAMRNAVLEMLEHSRPDDKYTPCWRAVQGLIRYYRKNRQHAGEIHQILSRIDPASLSTETYTITVEEKGRKLEKEQSSPREDWYSWESKALMDLRKYEECIGVCRQGLAALDRFHYDNDAWMLYRQGSSEYATGRLEEAEEHMRQAYRMRAHWSMLFGLFAILRKQGRNDEALQYGCRALQGPRRELELKVKALQRMGEFLEEQGDRRMAAAHLALMRKIREVKGWQLAPELVDKADRLAEGEDIPADPLPLLEKFWRDNRFKGERQLNGKIEKMLPNNRAGFIKAENGESYYFSVQNLKFRNPGTGMEVTFYLEDGFDRKKNRSTKNAVEIRIHK